MLEMKGTALLIFTGFNVMGLGFLLYVLVQFWKEEHKSGRTNRIRSRMSAYGAGPKVVLATSPIGAESRREGGGLIQFPVRANSEQQDASRIAQTNVRHAAN